MRKKKKGVGPDTVQQCFQVKVGVRCQARHTRPWPWATTAARGLPGVCVCVPCVRVPRYPSREAMVDLKASHSHGRHILKHMSERFVWKTTQTLPGILFF